jgi:integrase
MKKRADGRYEKVVTVDGHRKTFYGSSIKEVNRKIYLYNKDNNKGVAFETVAWDWKSTHMDELSYGSQRAYTKPFYRLVERFGKKSITDISYKEVQQFFSSLGLSYKSASLHKTVLNQIFNYAIVELNMDISNPCDRIKLDSHLPKSYRSAATPEQEQAILNTTADELLIAPIIYYTGLRCGEVLGLRYCDVDYEKDVINVKQAVVHHGNRPVISAPKTPNAIRTVPLLPQLKVLIGQGNPTHYIVGGEKPLTKSALDKRWKRWEKDHGVKIDRHSIRHTYATKLYEAGVGIKSAQSLLGHADAQTTLNVYTHLNQNHVTEAAEKLGEIFK